MKELPESIKRKLEIWQSQNEEFKKSLEEGDSDKVQFLLEAGCPIYLHELLSDEEISKIGDSYYDNLTDNFYHTFSDVIEMSYLREDREHILELLAQYLMFQTNEIAFRFRYNYFSHTKNYTTALGYAETLFTSLGFLKNQSNSWLKGAMFNDSNEFFDSFYSIYQEHQDYDAEYFNKLDAFKGAISKAGKYYNLESWKKHFNNHFPLVLDKRINDLNCEFIDVYSLLILEMINYPLDEYENGSFKNKQRVKPIIDFLVNDFASESEINKLDYMLVAILYEKEKETLWQLEKNSSNTLGSRRPMRRLFSNLSLNSTLKRNTSKLDYYIEQCIGQNDAKDCLDIFKLLELPSNRYAILENYVDICQGNKINDVHCKKINKI